MSKACIRCHTEKPASEFHVNKRRKDGLQPLCKPCACAVAKAHYELRSVKHLPDPSVASLVCTKCCTSKPVEWFRLEPRNVGGRIHRCIDCERKSRREYSRKISARRRERHARLKNDPAYQAKRRLQRQRQYQKDKVKSFARTKAYRALMSGKLVRRPCEKCGSENVEMHHTDYSKPLVVVWLCVKCHNEAHWKYA